MLVEQLGPQIRPAPARAAIEIEGLDRITHGTECEIDDDAVAAHAHVDHQIAVLGRPVGQREVGGGDAGPEEDCVTAARARLVDQVGAVADVEIIGVVMGAAREIVVAGAAVEGVVARAAGEGVISRPARQGVVAGGAGQHGTPVDRRQTGQFGLDIGPVPDRAAVEFEGLDAIVGIAQHLIDGDAFAAGADVDHQIGGILDGVGQDQIGGRDTDAEDQLVGAAAVGLVDEVRAVAEIEIIGVIAAAAHEIIVARAAGQVIVAIVAEEIVIARAAGQGVGEIGAANGVVAGGGRLGQHLRDEIVEAPHRGVVELEGLDGVFIGPQGLVDDNAVAVRADLDHQVVDIGHIEGEREIGGGDTDAEFQGVGTVGIGLVENVRTVADVELIEIVAEAAVDIIVAGAAL